jgi:hypothetical protein
MVPLNPSNEGTARLCPRSNLLRFTVHCSQANGYPKHVCLARLFVLQVDKANSFHVPSQLYKVRNDGILLNPGIFTSLSPGDGFPHHVAGAGWLLPRGVGAPHRRLQPGQLPGLLYRGMARGHSLAEAAQHGAHHLLPVQHGHGHPDLLRHPALPAEVGCSALSTCFLIFC